MTVDLDEIALADAAQIAAILLKHGLITQDGIMAWVQQNRYVLWMSHDTCRPAPTPPTQIKDFSK